MRDRLPSVRRALAGCALFAAGAAAAVASALDTPAASSQVIPTTTTATTQSTETKPAPAPAPAAAPPAPASLSTDLPCYLINKSVQLAGGGFSAGAPYTVTVDGTQVGSGTVAADGTLTGRLPSGRLVRGATHLKHSVSVSDGASRTATTEFQVTQFSAGFSPTVGNPATLIVRYAIYGFGLGRAAPLDPTPMPVYIHYIAPDGHSRLTVHLGRTHGRCGSLPRTRPRHLFPFTPAAGTWHLQFDLHPFYSPRSTPRVAQALVVR